MPISLKELNNMRAEVEVDIYGQTMMCVYKLDGFTDDVLKLIDEAVAGNNVTAAQKWRVFLQKILVSWELTDDRDKVLPISKEILDKLNGKVIDKMAAAVLGDRDPNLIKTASSPRLQAVE